MINKIRNATSSIELMAICNENLKERISGDNNDIVKPQTWEEAFLVAINNGNALFRDKIIELKKGMVSDVLKQLNKPATCGSDVFTMLDSHISIGLLGAFLNQVIDKGVSWDNQSELHKDINKYADLIESVKETDVPFKGSL